MSTPVLFRAWKSNGAVIAFFLGTYGDPDVCNLGMMQAYMHVGQRGEADYYRLLAVTRPARQAEYAELRREIESIYGPVRVITRFRRTR